MLRILSKIWHIILIGIVFMIVRSPVMMGLLGFAIGVGSYHFNPELFQGYIQYGQEYIFESFGICMKQEGCSDFIKGNLPQN